MRILLFVLAIFLFQSSCKQSISEKKVDSDTEIIQNDTKDPRLLEENYVKMEKAERSLPTERALAQSKLDRYYEKNEEAMQMLTSMIYEIDNIMKVNQEPMRNLQGYHFDFRNDFTYEFYKEGKLAEAGKYYYGLESNLILMLPESEEQFPSEWKLVSSGVAMVFAGTSTFSNNNTQIHMVGKER